ncbi:death-inducer obliterator 1 [Drosophila virilis]|uniref:Uncharacterized protein, isoform A n=1 Tax=Drosophila virilis TaxID=7244 RepID=B4LY97_DROVI|nr:death-inducer obliterator 1 [Drosophila virilis]EDW67985.1 uncharacterized protein Dvir_GJ24469, isoform A [Drosophila virilis]KRF83599.1 uncharacterized protein Dvir_GJ24469, isoform B [Drosophila virilis]
MSSSVFSEPPSSRPNGADGDSNLVVVYTKNGISFDERAIENIMEEKSIASISVVRLTSPTPSMVDQEETERLEELERFLEAATDREESDTDNDSQSGGDELISEKDHVTGDDNDNTGCENNGDSTETEAEVPKVKKRPGRKPKAPKKQKKRRKPKERPQIVGLSVEQFYAESSADLVVKNALKLAGLSIFKRTPETDALLEIIRNDHNYTPFTSPEQMKAQKTAERMALERQTVQGRKFIVHTQSNVKMLSAKKRFQVVPIKQVHTTTQQPLRQQQLPPKPPQQQQRQSQQLLKQPTQLHRQQVHNQLQQPPATKQQQIILPGPRSVRSTANVISPAEEYVEDDEDANSSATADEENGDTEEHSEPSDASRETDNDRDSDIDFKMNNSRSANKRRRIKKFSRRSQSQSARGQTVTTPKAQQQQPAQSSLPHFKRRKEQTDSNLSAPAIGQIVQLNTKAPPSVIALGRNILSTSFLKMRPTHKTLPPATALSNEANRMSASAVAAKMRRAPFVQVGRVVNVPPGGFATPPQEVKEIIINKNLSSPKGVFTNLNSLLAENNNTAVQTSTPDNSKQILLNTPSTPKPNMNPLPTPAPVSSSSKGFMPIGVETASSHKLPAQIVIETHQSSSELAAENDKQLDLIDSIVQDELLKASFIEKPPATADENIPKLVKMLESTAACLDQVSEPTMNALNVPQQQSFDGNLVANAVVDNIDIDNARLLETPDEDEITADFLQHVVGLIEEDKQFEAEVVKQVLASTETGALDAIANVVAPPIFDVASQLSTIAQPLLNDFPANVVTSSLSNLPMACSTPARSTGTLTLSSRPETKIVRGNGRVIYLPPIEAPTTRAKRRAQNFPVTVTTMSDISTTSLTEPNLDSSHLTSSSLDSDSFSSQIGGVARKQLPRESAGSVRRPRRSNKSNISSEANDPEASESQEDDDDPNKLWCICRQPHNNRFMICCDLCEDWYHGTCVSVTKAMGLEMEQKGIDWKCPKCVKKQEEKTQPRITDMLLPKQIVDPAECVQPNESKATVELLELTPKLSPTVSGESVTSVPTNTSSPLVKQQKRQLLNKPQPRMHQQQLHFIKLGGSSFTSNTDVICVVCKRPARVNSVYCSDECIRKYAQTAIQAQTVPKTPEPTQQTAATQPPLANALEAKKNKKKDLFEDVLRQADSMSKVERINVFERRSGRAITGHLAPTAQQLKKWLQDNPSFEVVQPGSQQAQEIEKRQNKRQLEHSTPEIITVKSSLSLPTQKTPESPNRSLQMLPAMPSMAKKEKPAGKATTTPSRSPEKSSTERPVSNSQPEPIRFNVRRTLKEQLLSRIKEAQAAELPTEKSDWLTAAEVENFVKRVESEMYHSFGRDVSAKYKSKYRSLMFNIKDRKNKTLFEKICAKQVEPKQLVRMTPAELASQELAKWREEENRHQLDMIKKSELDLLSCAQNYVVKTHKGEEVIESKLDVTLPEEESELEANKSKFDSYDSKKSSQSIMDTSPATEVNSKEKSSRSREKERSRDRDRDKRHRSHKHHHHQSGNKRSRSRSSSRGRSQEKRSHKRHHHENELDKEKEQPTRDKPSNKEHAEKVQSPLHKKPNDKKAEPPLVAFNLVDQILESEKTVEEAANLTQPVKQTLKSLPVATKTTAKIEVPTPTLDRYARYVQGLPNPAIWTGNLNMVDVTNFDVVIHSVHGDTNQLDKLLPINLDVIGRITRVNVWEYLKKIKKSPTKEIVIVSLFPASVSNTVRFDSFFEYLDSRQRLGVLGADSENIRDFYIFPLGTRDKLPTVLHTLESVPFYEDTQRPNTLLGIIVRCLSKRLVNLSQTLPLPLTTASNKTAKSSSKTRVRTTFTPPSSPKRKHSTHSTSSKDDEFDIDAIIKAPIAKLQKSNVSAEALASIDDPNAPYSPGGSSDDNDDLPTSAPGNKNDLERKVNEINRQIAAQRMEIAGLLNVEPSILDKPSSSSKMLASISIPPNLTKILASLKEKSESQTRPKSSEDEEYNPEDAITSNSSYGMATKSAVGATKAKSRLAQLSEAELLSMVPDNMVDLTPTNSATNDEPPPPGV